MAKLLALKSVKTRTGTRDSGSAIFTVKDIPIGDIEIRGNIRSEYNGIFELAASICQHGLLQPITVYSENGAYLVKTGHRRYLACKELYRKEPDRFHSIRCIVSDAQSKTVVQLVENIQRLDLSQADLFNALTELKAQGMTLRQIADVMGKTEGYVKSLFVGVNEINRDKDYKDLIGDAGITIRDIAETTAVTDKQDRLNLLEERKNGTINRAEMREKVKHLKSPETKENTPVAHVNSVKLKKVHVSIKAYPELNKIIVYQVKGGNGEQLVSIEKDLRTYFAANNTKYCVEKTLPYKEE